MILTYVVDFMIIEKRSGKPFKNKLKFARVVGEGVHPVTNKPTYVLEDDSYVEQRMVKKVDLCWYSYLRIINDKLKPESMK